MVGSRKIKRTQKDFLIRANSWLIAIAISIFFISIAINSKFDISDSLVSISMLILLILKLLLLLFNGIRRISINKKGIFMILFILVLFRFSFLNSTSISYVNIYFREFLGYGLVSFVLLSSPYSYKLIVRNVSRIGLLFLLSPSYIVESLVEKSDITMGVSYAILPCILAAVIHFIYYRKDKKLIDILAYIVNLVMSINLILQASRGAVLSVVLLLFLVWFIKIRKENGSGAVSIAILFLSFITILAFIFAEELLGIFIELLGVFNIKFYFLEKTYRMIAEEGLIASLNGRDYIYINSINMIREAPILGNGIGAYADKYGTYPHNFILQMMSELGIILSIPLFLPILKSLVTMCKKWTNEEDMNYRVFVLFLFMSSIPRLMLSSYFWKNQIFWMLIFISLSKRSKNVINIFKVPKT